MSNGRSRVPSCRVTAALRVRLRWYAVSSAAMLARTPRGQRRARHWSRTSGPGGHPRGQQCASLEWNVWNPRCRPVVFTGFFCVLTICQSISSLMLLRFLAATKQLYECAVPSVRPSVRHTL